MSSAPLRVEGLVRRFGTRTVLDGVSLEVPAGTIVGFLGANGAGKTTALRCITGLLGLHGGHVTVAGADLLREPTAARARYGFVPDRPFLYERLSAREFLDFVGALHGLDPAAARMRADLLLARLGLAEHADRTLDGYSLGMRQKTAIAAALLHAPTLLLLDEPLNGLDPPSTRVLKELLREHAESGGGVLVSTHLLDVAEHLCDRVVLLRSGRVVAAGTLDELRQGDPTRSLEDVFLGLTAS